MIIDVVCLECEFGEAFDDDDAALREFDGHRAAKGHTVRFERTRGR